MERNLTAPEFLRERESLRACATGVSERVFKRLELMGFISQHIVGMIDDRERTMCGSVLECRDALVESCPVPVEVLGEVPPGPWRHPQ